jgi:hypothetical protein
MLEPTGSKLELEFHSRMADIPRADWDALADHAKSPLLEWEWLYQLEESESISKSTGWLPQHLTLRRDGRLIAAAPLYVKTHSAGEFVFDYAWADVARQLGLQYYPKLVGMSPASPCEAYRFLVDPAEDEEELSGIMIEAMHEFSRENGMNSLAFNWAQGDWADMIAPLGFVGWKHQIYEWRNERFDSFDDYLSAFTKNQRKNIRKEVRSMGDQGLRMVALNGDEIPDRYFSLLYDFYENTNDQFGPWAAKFLYRGFFERLAERFKHRLLLVAAVPENGATLQQGEESGSFFRRSNRKRNRRPGDPVGMSFCVVKDDQLIGRYWGSEGFYDNLHFNACYYKPIEWAIEHGVKRFDPGMGSPHKVRRGFRAVGSYSLHHFYNDQMQIIMRSNIGRINNYTQAQIDHLNEGLPFKEKAGARNGEAL